MRGWRPLERSGFFRIPNGMKNRNFQKKFGISNSPGFPFPNLPENIGKILALFRVNILLIFNTPLLCLDEQVPFGQPVRSQGPAKRGQFRIPIGERKGLVPLVRFGIELDERFPVSHFPVDFGASSRLSKILQQLGAAGEPLAIALVLFWGSLIGVC